MSKESAELAELVTIRKLMILALLRSGMSQADVGAALGVHRTQIGRMFPKGATANASGKGAVATTRAKSPPSAEAED